jgi:hypothetical protein
MRVLPVLAVLVASVGLSACSINSAPPRQPDVVAVQPAPTPMMMAPASGSTVVVRP